MCGTVFVPDSFDIVLWNFLPYVRHSARLPFSKIRHEVGSRDTVKTEAPTAV